MIKELNEINNYMNVKKNYKRKKMKRSFYVFAIDM